MEVDTALTAAVTTGAVVVGFTANRPDTVERVDFESPGPAPHRHSTHA
jgi:hypothetical protein